MTVSRRPRPAALVLAIAASLGLAALAPPPAKAKDAAAGAAQALIPYEEFTLPNGLRVVVHTDRKAPIVAVNVWYHVGSKDEPAGRSGFAHLFEHLMFNGSENHPGEYFEPFELVGATDMNGTTWLDRTNYFQNVPTTALDLALWMESDRMGHLLGAIDQKTLDEQRGVVQNEKRQGENQPYGQADDEIYRALYPKGHPYHHSTIGSMNDLNAASLEDVKQWFRAWYGPNNAVLVLAGDIDLATAREKAARYFGGIPAGPALPRVQAGPARRDATRATMTDKVPQARIYRAWSVDRYGSTDLEYLTVLARVLGGSKSSRLDRRLVFDEKLADKVSAYVQPFELASTFYVSADVKQGVDPARVEAIIGEEIARLLAEGPTAAELQQAQTVLKAQVVRGVERIGGFGGKADALAECAVYTGNPGCYRDSLAAIERATASDLQRAGRAWLGDGSHTLVVLPGERTVLEEEPSPTPAPFDLPRPDAKYATTDGKVDRSGGVPMPERFPDLKFPALERATLSNGTAVILARRDAVPVVQFSYEFKGGFAADRGRKLGTSSFTMAMLDEGAGELDALGFANRAESLGASLAAGASLDGANASLSALKENLDASLGLYADMLRRPRFEQKEIDRVRATWLAGIAQEKARPNGAAQRVLPPLLYGEGHPYAIPFSGSGTEASIAALTRDDLAAFHRQWVRPDGATLIVVGDTTLAEVVPLLEKHFGDWKAGAPAIAAEAIPAVQRPARPAVYLIDQPGAVQATLLAGQVVPSTKDPGSIRFDVANSVLGGEFSSRLNMNLREDKHWAYGAYSFASGALGQRPWMAFAPVQIDRTAESLAELDREVRQYASGKAPPSAAEVAKIQATEIRSLPGAYETGRAVMGAIGGIVRYDRPDDYVVRRKAEIESLTVDQVKQAATALDPDRLVWVVVGDLKQVEQPVRALGLGEVRVVDADGRPAAAAE
ncbi:peptidase M16 [Pseudoxanthomonas broegbernensis]|uniref:Peptidase M16 n=1 Tax=Pseudoxanthomonas broegbernensis TaxID=83619 RepID=A0A7V8K7K3_9GAMM|nr:pitrilysin family protein [Pseudoxanthomonas broegbernensis]KAF1686992.1 peptidase M16 [Pseudoxanthomonas broegbernensis]MBB6065392.1 putative Zn-dependent peptidase [Pseudoxanthomonas broegbernensis]